MNATFTWSISDLTRQTQTGIVYSCVWALRAAVPVTKTDFEGKTFESEEYAITGGVENFEDPGPNYIPFEELTEEIVIGWLKNTLGGDTIATLEESLVSSLKERLHPKQSEGLPWS